MLLDPGKTITFYSYKGGTGRTMALANVACLLAQETTTDTRPVLMIDWDLEAPGLHRFFRDQLSHVTAGVAEKDEKLDQERGLLDFFMKLKDATDQYDEKQPQRQADARQLLDQIRPEDFALRTDVSGLFLLKAGRIDDAYSKNVNTFGWEAFYNRAPWLIRSFGERLAKLYRYVLIDSRTGLTDVSGICTMLLPETLVFVFTPNRQSIRGGFELIKRATNYRRNSSDFRPLVVFPLVSRVEPARDTLRRDWRMGNPDKGIEGYQPLFERLFKDVYQLEVCSLEDYFQEVQVQHNPDYAYGEVIAAQVETTEDRLSLKRSYRTFVERLTSTPSPWQKESVLVKTAESEATSTVIFPNGNSAQLLLAKPEMMAKDIARALRLKNAAALFLIIETTENGGDRIDERISSLLTNSVSRIAGDVDALILDRGVGAGAVKLVAEGIAQRGRVQNLLGVAVRNRVTYPGQQHTDERVPVPLEANHTHFILVEGQEWGDEIEVKYEVAKELARDTPVVAILVGGNDNTLKELFRIVKLQWPIIVIEGSGDLADQVALSHRAFQLEFDRLASTGRSVKDRYTVMQASYNERGDRVREIAVEGNIAVFPAKGDAAELERIIYRCLPEGRALDAAWDSVTAYDRQAVGQQRLARFLQTAFLSAGVLGVAVAVSPAILAQLGLGSSLLQRVLATASAVGMFVLFQFLIVQRPERLAEQLGAAAEAIKSEVFYFRSRTGSYGNRLLPGMTAASALLERIEGIKKATGTDPAGSTNARSRDKQRTISDEGFSALSPERYFATRLEDQLHYYSAKILNSNRQRRFSNYLMMGILSLAAVASYSHRSLEFVSLGGVAITAITVAMALLGARGLSQREQQVRSWEIILRQLTVIRNWWLTLTTDEKALQKNADRLVSETEEALNSAWQIRLGELNVLNQMKTQEGLARLS